MRNKKLQAAALALLACVFVALMTLSIRAVGKVEGAPLLPPQEVTFFRFAFGLLALSPLLLFHGPKVLRTERLPRHFLRCVFGALGVAMAAAALAQLPLAPVTAVTFASPFVTLIFAALFLGEKVAPIRWLATLAGFAGVLVITDPGGALFNPAILFAVLAAIFMGMEVGVIKLLTRSESMPTILLLNNMIGMALAGLATAPFWVTPQGAQWLYLAGAGFSVVAGQSLFLAALKRADATFVAPFNYSTLLFATLFGFVFFAESPQAQTILGAALIIGAGLWLVFGGRQRAPAAVTD